MLARTAALTVVLMLASTLAATAACLAWCGSPCEQMPSDTAVQAAQHASLDAPPYGPPHPDDSRRRVAPAQVKHPAVELGRLSDSALESQTVAFTLSHAEPPPGSFKAPTVLRL